MTKKERENHRKMMDRKLEGQAREAFKRIATAAISAGDTITLHEAWLIIRRELTAVDLLVVSRLGLLTGPLRG